MENDALNYHFETLKIESVELPDTLNLGETHKIKIKYYNPSTCHSFRSFIYEKNLNTRTIAVQSIVTERDVCFPLNGVIEEEVLNFYVTNNGSYIFKFWQGKNDVGEDIYLTIEVPVVD